MRILLHSQHRITETVKTILAEAKKLSGVEEEMQFAPLEEDYIPPRGVPVLSLGSYQRRGQERVVQTYSGAQIVTKADSLTRLSTAFQLLHKVPELPEFKFEVIDTLWRLQEVEELLVGKLLVVDIETKGSVDAQIPGWEHIISLAFYDGECAYVITEHLSQHPQARDMHLERILSTAQLVAHNGKFDLKYLSHFENIYPFADTMLMHYALYPAASDHGLKPLALEYFGAEDWDSKAKKHLTGRQVKEYTVLEDGAYASPDVVYTAKNGYERIPRTMLYEYNAMDVYWTWWLYQEFKVLLENDANAKRLLDDHLMDISHMFQRVETIGTRYDKAYMEERAVELSAEAVVLEEELSIAAGRVLNPRSPVQLKKYFTEQGFKLKSTDAETLETLVMETGDEVARIVQLCRGNTKTNGTYTTGYLKQLIGDRGYPTFKVHAASTGRIGGGGPSLLTIPRDKKIKRMVLPDEGMVMVGADLSQAELRVMAIESGDPWMIAAFQPGAGDFFDLLMENTYTDLNAIEHKASDPQAYTDLRAKFKGVVYGVSFGRQAKAIAYALGITVKEAIELMNAFVRPGSPFALWREEITRRAVQGEAIINRFGRKFQSELITKQNRQNVINSALSFMSQSTANDICLSAAVVVEKELPSYGSRLLTTLHDALYAPAYEARADEVGKYLSDELEAAGKRVYGDVVAFKSDFGWGNNLAEA